MVFAIVMPLLANASIYDGFSGVDTVTLTVSQETFTPDVRQTENWRVEVDALWPQAPTGKVRDINGEVALVRGEWDSGANNMSSVWWETAAAAPWWQTDLNGIGQPDPKVSTEPNVGNWATYDSSNGVVPRAYGKHVFAARMLCSRNHDGATPYDEMYSNPVGIFVVSAPDLDIDGIGDPVEMSQGGLVVRNYDSNNAPRNKDYN